MMELQQQYHKVLGDIQNNSVMEKELEELIKQAEKSYQKEINACVSFNHTVESFYYEYFINKEDYTVAPVNMGLLYRTLGNLYQKENKLRKAETSYNRAYRWNPVDLDTLYVMIEYNKTEGDIDKVYSLTKRCYDLCCTRADLAHYYRNLGFYYLESYNPTLAEVLYEYSQCFYETKQAESELLYIEKALNKKRSDYSVEQMQQVLSENKIPVMANEMTIAITYRVGMMLLEDGNMEQARDCFLMVYDLTKDDEVKEILSKLG